MILQISLTGGAAWQPLKRPKHMRHAVCDQCSRAPDQDKCQLHLHGPASFTQGPGDSFLPDPNALQCSNFIIHYYARVPCQFLQASRNEFGGNENCVSLPCLHYRSAFILSLTPDKRKSDNISGTCPEVLFVRLPAGVKQLVYRNQTGILSEPVD